MKNFLYFVVALIVLSFLSYDDAFAQRKEFGFNGEYGHAVMAIKTKEDNSTVAQFYSGDRVSFAATKSLLFFGPDVGFGIDYSFIMNDFSSFKQTIDEPTEEPNPSTGKNTHEVGSRIWGSSLGLLIEAVYVIGQKSDYPFRFYYGMGYLRSHITGNALLTHSTNRSSECTTAVESEHDQVNANCEDLQIDTWTTNKFTHFGFRWNVIDGKYFSYSIGLTQQKPMKIEHGDYTLNRISDRHWFISMHSH